LLEFCQMQNTGNYRCCFSYDIHQLHPVSD
jgi:hypothetical protein